MAFSKSSSTRPTSLQRPRAKTSMANHLEEGDDDKARKGQGMIPLPSLPYSNMSQPGCSTIHIKKFRDPKSTSSLCSQSPREKMRDISLSTGMSMLSIGDDGLLQAEELGPRHSNNNPRRILKTDNTENALVLYEAAGDSLVAPKTPSQIPVLSKMEAVVLPTATPSKTPKTPKTPRISSPNKLPFLSKTSNIPGFIAFDIDGRFASIETMYADMRAQMEGVVSKTTVERSSLDEAVALCKARVTELEILRAQLTAQNDTLQSELNAARQRSDVFQDKLVDAKNELGTLLWGLLKVWTSVLDIYQLDKAWESVC